MQGAAHGTAVLAAEQTRGRGTKGRAWHSPAGLGPLRLVRPPRPGRRARALPHILPLAVGLAAADAVREAAGLEAGLKWPNDLVHRREEARRASSARRVTGAAGGGFVVAGIGINVGHGPDDFPEDLRPLATSLRLAGRPGA
ncbi:MAG: hypothetical protein MZU79_04875 [Anaerotruncus sp.]|nr:hypothetical protein [Anaerotruncus sp.]